MAVLHAVCEVEHVLVVRGEAHHLAVRHDGVAVVRLKQVRGADGLLLLLYEPCVEVARLHDEERLDLPGGALREGVLRLVVADPADDRDEQGHDRSHQEQLLFDIQNIVPFLSMVLFSERYL